MKRCISLLMCLVFIVAMALTLVACGDAHQHTYSDLWEYDSSKHWLKSTCSEDDDCINAKAAETVHDDANEDGACDVCGYVYEN